VFLARLVVAHFASGLAAQASASRLLYAMGRASRLLYAMGRDSVLRRRRAGQQLNPVYYVVVPVIGALICACHGEGDGRGRRLSPTACDVATGPREGTLVRIALGQLESGAEGCGRKGEEL
jgi:hypothetical protein